MVTQGTSQVHVLYENIFSYMTFRMTFWNSLCLFGKYSPINTSSGEKVPCLMLSSKSTFLCFALGCWAETANCTSPWLSGSWLFVPIGEARGRLKSWRRGEWICPFIFTCCLCLCGLSQEFPWPVATVGSRLQLHLLSQYQPHHSPHLPTCHQRLQHLPGSLSPSSAESLRFSELLRY